ncbi:SagB/ThcOx family dehydrogenase [Variovorax guangxiensis]|uniref:SagB/ThcOx family dehydrogenase n=1 Tax=Variovorax guangxiensis TaxID=1775474 RepID=A0A3S0XDU4_9BURK|nr:nitroreductase family protein [Variovorax guangxiensis]RUR71065.1 SagB/ThcOx family dehydrogenase [Variovorax guangxiensis]
MTWLDLGNPRPRSEAQRYTPVHWPQGKRIPLQPLAKLSSDDSLFKRSFMDLAIRRRSAREFAPLPLDRLGWLLALANQQLACGPQHLGFPLTQRPSPSAGAIHPVHLIAQNLELGGWNRYDPMGHELVSVPGGPDVHVVRKAMDELVTAPAATLLLLVAEPGKTAAKYLNSDSLVWRDAGILLGYLSLAAEALGLAFVPLGITGEPWAGKLVDEPGLAGVGAALVGARV